MHDEEHKTVQRENLDLDLDERTVQIVMNKVMAIETDDDELKTEIFGPVDSFTPLPGADFCLDKLSVQPPGKYRFIRSIGFGGMKTVTKVHDCDTGRNVAMASIPDAAERNPQDLTRFVHEAFITARLEHPNIVPVHDIGIDSSGAPYFTMKLLRGYTLARLLKRLRNGEPQITAKYNEERLLFLFMRICNAVGFAHSQQIIHLDLKPENVFVGEFGEVSVIDWGLAKYLGESGKTNLPENTAKDGEDTEKIKTSHGVARGTPGYMSPEQAAGLNEHKDKRSDIYSLGAILYKTLTLCQPFSGATVGDILRNTTEGNIVPPNQLKDLPHTIPAALEAIVLKAMHRHPDGRYQNVNELREDLFAYIGGYATNAESPGTLKKSAMFFKRHSYSVLFFVVLTLLLTICGLLAWLFYNGILGISLN